MDVAPSLWASVHFQGPSLLVCREEALARVQSLQNPLPYKLAPGRDSPPCFRTAVYEISRLEALACKLQLGEHRDAVWRILDEARAEAYPIVKTKKSEN